MKIKDSKTALVSFTLLVLLLSVPSYSKGNYLWCEVDDFLVSTSLYPENLSKENRTVIDQSFKTSFVFDRENVSIDSHPLLSLPLNAKARIVAESDAINGQPLIVLFEGSGESTGSITYFALNDWERNVGLKQKGEFVLTSDKIISVRGTCYTISEMQEVLSKLNN